MIVFKTWIIFEKQSLHHLHFTMCKCWHFYVVKKKQSKEKKGIFNFTQVLYRDSFIIWNRFSEYQAQTTLSLSELEILTTYKICNRYIVSMWVLSLSSRVWLCNPMEYNLPGFSGHGISQARILEQVAISFSVGSSQPRDWTRVSCISSTGRWILYPWATGVALISTLGSCYVFVLILQFT